MRTPSAESGAKAAAGILQSRIRESLAHDLGWLKGPLAWSGLTAAAVLQRSGSEALRSRAFSLLMRVHTGNFSPSADRVVLDRLRDAIHREPGRSHFRQALASIAAESVRKFQAGPRPESSRLLGTRILVVKSHTATERGVLIIDYQYVFPLLAGLFDLPRISERYDVVLEPSWSDVCAPEILLFTKAPRPVYVQTTEPRDLGVLSRLDTNLRPVPLAANWWIDPRNPPPTSAPRDIDVIMVAAWADVKRHWRVFRALADLRRRGHRLRTVLVGYPYDRTKEDIGNLAHYFGIADQVEMYEKISQDEVAALLARSKVHVLWSRRECANRAVIEAMVADVPVIVRDGMTFGFRYPYINEHTGRFVREPDLADAILEMIETRSRYSPRNWVLENMTCVHATRVLQERLQRERQETGDPWLEDLVVKTSTLDTQRYYSPEDAQKFEKDYAFLESARLSESARRVPSPQTAAPAKVAAAVSAAAGTDPWPVAVFAHNEESRIIRSLESIAKASATHPIQAYVLANGCTDRTESVVRNFAATHPWVTLVSLKLGDKANAWNVFVHDVVTRIPQVCFFVDGDIRVEPGAFDALFSALQASPSSNAAAAVPSTGRSKQFLAHLVIDEYLVLGNLYALRGDFVALAKKTGARFPIGYIGEDGLVTSLAKWNLDPTGPFRQERIIPCPDAQFVFRSLSLWSRRDWRVYWRRRVRYSLRHFQHELLVPLLRTGGLRGMPGSVSDLYKQQASLLRGCRPRLGMDAVFDRIALSQMRKELSRDDGRAG